MEVRIYELQPPPEMDKVFEATHKLAFMSYEEFKAETGREIHSEHDREKAIMAYVQEKFATELAICDAMVESMLGGQTKH